MKEQLARAVQKTRQNMFKSVDASSLVVFRIGFGIIMLWEVWRYWSYGWIAKYYIDPPFNFTYFGFEWVKPWPGEWMYVHYAVVALLALFITIGLFYRLSAYLFLIAFSYIFLLEQAHYLNHLYLVILVSLILCFVPAHRYFAVDALRQPQKRTDTVPAWSVWLLRAQFEVVYIYAGIVKINPDWLRLEPLSAWLARRSDMPYVGDFFLQDWSVGVAAYGIIILHIIGAPLLLWRKTRIYIFLIYACFHILNHFVFSIGIFPWMTLFATLIFFDPDWPKQAWRKAGALLRLPKERIARIKSANTDNTLWLPTPARQNFIIAAVGIWFAYQVLMPLRHLLYPGSPSWTEEGHKYAWQMKLRDKDGATEFIVRDPATGKSWEVEPEDFLNRRQVRKMSTRPDMILQFAHYLAHHWEVDYHVKNPEVRVVSMVSLNGRKAAPMIDPTADLAKIERSLKHADWILPLDEPLNRSPEKYRSIYTLLRQYKR